MKYKLVVMGTSLGGLSALQTVLAGLSKEFNLPVAIAQHRGSGLNGLLTRHLQESSLLPVEEAEDKAPIEPGRVYIAPADYHLLVEEGNFALSTEAPVQHSRPSIDVLFESAAYTYGPQLIGVILTGSNRDGARGSATLKERGGWLVVQQPATAESPVMPQASLDNARADRVLALAEIAPHLNSLAAE